jgi:SAM-dependent methyltransferase
LGTLPTPPYSRQLGTLRDLFGRPDVELVEDGLQVGDRRYPIVDGVVVLLDKDQYPESLRSRLSAPTGIHSAANFAPDIQSSFGAEWREFSEILPEHDREFAEYFDLVSLDSLHGKRVCDLGCGSGRWSHFLRGHCRERILIDFSDAIFVARRNLEGDQDALFFMADLTRLPFRPGFADFIFCLGVLHHLPVPALHTVRSLANLAPRLLIYLYYSLDNRPFHYRALLSATTAVRSLTARVRNKRARTALAWAGAVAVYRPLVALGSAFELAGRGSAVPLFETYRGKSLRRIRQDVYDRFFTRIEQRVSRAEVEALADTFAAVRVSPNPPYWHFLCETRSTDQPGG